MFGSKKRLSANLENLWHQVEELREAFATKMLGRVAHLAEKYEVLESRWTALQHRQAKLESELRMGKTKPWAQALGQDIRSEVGPLQSNVRSLQLQVKEMRTRQADLEEKLARSALALVNERVDLDGAVLEVPQHLMPPQVSELMQVLLGQWPSGAQKSRTYMLTLLGDGSFEWSKSF